MPQEYRARRREGAFTLIELLVVIAIIALLIGILLPAIGRARQSAQDLRCQANNRSIGQAMLMYSSDYKDWFPVIPADPGTGQAPLSRREVMAKQQYAGGVAGFFSLFQVGDAEWSGSGAPVGDRGYIGGPVGGVGAYVNGEDTPVMRGYLEAFEVLTCPRDKEDRYYGTQASEGHRYLQGVSKIPEPPAREQDVISYNISYLYFAGLRPLDPDVLVPPVIWGDETNTNDISRNAFYGYDWYQDRPGDGLEPQAVLDQVGFNKTTGYGTVDNHGDAGGNFVFSDGHVEFITVNPQRTFFANPRHPGISEELKQQLRTEAKSINLRNPLRSDLMRTTD